MKSIGEISVSDAQRAGFREFSSCEGGKQRSRRSLNIVVRKGGGTDCARSRTPSFRPRCSRKPRSSVNADETESGLGWVEHEGNGSGEIECDSIQKAAEGWRRPRSTAAAWQTAKMRTEWSLRAP